MSILDEFKRALRHCEFNGILMKIYPTDATVQQINNICVTTFGGDLDLTVGAKEFNSRMTIITLSATQENSNLHIYVGEVAFNKVELIYPIKCKLSGSFKIITLERKSDFEILADICAKNMFYIVNNIHRLYNIKQDKNAEVAHPVQIISISEVNKNIITKSESNKESTEQNDRDSGDSDSDSDDGIK